MVRSLAALEPFNSAEDGGGQRVAGRKVDLRPGPDDREALVEEGRIAPRGGIRVRAFERERRLEADVNAYVFFMCFLTFILTFG